MCKFHQNPSDPIKLEWRKRSAATAGLFGMLLVLAGCGTTSPVPPVPPDVIQNLVSEIMKEPTQ